MSDKKHLCQTPVPSSEFSIEAELIHDTIRFGFHVHGQQRMGGIQFKRIKATRTRAESACTAWHIEDAYDTLVEVLNSDWVKELQSDTAEVQRLLGQSWPLRHYMIYMDSSGCFEIIAESWESLS